MLKNLFKCQSSGKTPSHKA